ncbi:MAG TPA: hypothetical protein VHC48_07755 [Puia sp.]|nr:hypothetical protein [Puia sp.]
MDGLSAPIHIDEYAGEGNTFQPVQSIDLPANVRSSSGAIFNTANPYEGYLTLSGNRRFLTVQGYDTILAGRAIFDLTNTPPYLVTGRIIAEIDQKGRVDLSTWLPDIMHAGNYRSAIPEGVISDDGTNLWMGSNQGLKGIACTSLSGSKITVVSSSHESIKSFEIFGGDLFAVAGYHKKVILVGSLGGLPLIPAGNISTSLQFNTKGVVADVLSFKPSQIVLFDLDAGIPGPDVMYISNASAVPASDQYGIYKYYKDTNNVWEPAGGYDYAPKDSCYFGITGVINNAGNPVLYATSGISRTPSAENNHLKEIVDLATTPASYKAIMKPQLVRDLSNKNSKLGGLIRGIAFVPQVDDSR